ncbi:MAG TPA: hypothetical protein VLH19_04240 [Patescibacteria group bacterium]|nr:hypothetical protein [Patescibacteria group bacterium]
MGKKDPMMSSPIFGVMFFLVVVLAGLVVFLFNQGTPLGSLDNRPHAASPTNTCSGQNSCFTQGIQYSRTDGTTVTTTDCASIGAAPAPNKTCGVANTICCGFIGSGSRTASNPTCAVALLSPSYTVKTGQKLTLTASVIPQNGTITAVNFGTYPIQGQTGTGSLTPTQDTTSPYTSSFLAGNVGQVLVQATGFVKSAGTAICETQQVVTVTP